MGRSSENRSFKIFLCLTLAFVLASCGVKKLGSETPPAGSETNAIPIILGGMALWELWLIAGVGAGVILYTVSQATGETSEQRFPNAAAADKYLKETQSLREVPVFRSQPVSSEGANLPAMVNQGAIARPPDTSKQAIPAAIGKQCKNQKRPEEGTCEQDACYISPSVGNANAARRIHSNKDLSEGNCFIYKWTGNPFGSDPAHGWLPHYHLYEIDKNGRCLKNIHFYYFSAGEEQKFRDYKGKCKKF